MQGQIFASHTCFGGHMWHGSMLTVKPVYKLQMCVQIHMWHIYNHFKGITDNIYGRLFCSFICYPSTTTDISTCPQHVLLPVQKTGDRVSA